ncbi:hypothetical protein ACXYTJ_14920 [Gilvimarinus sp. F26214L]|uniref:hypothetical protein n=1 Tax=Gilvimarinus sp. DZF01 TaxID=3461371 RepID=UPI004045704C
MQPKNYKPTTDLKESAALEDEIFLQMDKLLALCVAQTALTEGEQELALGTRSYYALVVEEQARRVRETLARLLG